MVLGPGQGCTAVSMSREPAYQRMSDIDMTIIGPVTKGKGPSQLPGGVRQARSPRGVSRAPLKADALRESTEARASPRAAATAPSGLAREEERV